MARDLFSEPFDPRDFTLWLAGAGYIDPKERHAYYMTSKEGFLAQAMVAFHVDMGDLFRQPSSSDQ